MRRKIVAMDGALPVAKRFGRAHDEAVLMGERSALQRFGGTRTLRDVGHSDPKGNAATMCPWKLARFRAPQR